MNVNKMLIAAKKQAVQKHLQNTKSHCSDKKRTFKNREQKKKVKTHIGYRKFCRVRFTVYNTNNAENQNATAVLLKETIIFKLSLYLKHKFLF